MLQVYFVKRLFDGTSDRHSSKNVSPRFGTAQWGV
jgi:hypothetical protein